MASVYRKTAPGARSPFWQAKFKGPNDTLLWLSTKLKTKSLAEKVAEQWEEAAAAAENKQLTQDKARAIVARVLAISKCAKTVKVTEKLMQTLLKGSLSEDFGGRNFQEFTAQWLKRREKDTAPSTFARYESVIALFLDSLPLARRTIPVDAISRSDVQRFCDNEIESGKAASTVRVSRSIISAMFNDACRQEIAQKNPAQWVDIQREDTDERIPFSDAMVKKLLGVADPEWKGVILFGFQAGLRLSDAANLTWNNVDLVEKVLTYTPVKTIHRKTRVTVPLHRDILAELDKLPAGDNPSQPLFPTLHGIPTNGTLGLSNQFGRLMKLAGVAASPGRAKSGKGRQFSQLSFHSLRHGAASRMANNGVSQEVRMQIVGHTSKEIHEGYTHLGIAASRAAIDALPSVL